MFPPNNSNDAYDARRRRSVRRSLVGSGGGIGNGPSQEAFVPPLMVARDSPAERVAVRKRKLTRNRQPSGMREEESMITPASIREEQLDKSASTDAAYCHRSPVSSRKSSSGDFVEFKLQTERKKLSSTDSSRSLDFAASLLQREVVMDQLQQERRSQSYHQRITMPLVGSTSGDSSIRTVTAGSGSGSGRPSLRSSLSDFKKTMLRHRKQNSTPNDHPTERRNSKSANECKNLPSFPVPAADEAATSEHRKLRKALGSSKDLLITVPDDIAKNKEDPSASRNISASQSPGLIKKLLSSGQRLSRSVSGHGSSSRLNNSSSSSKHCSSLESDDDMSSISSDIERHSASTNSMLASMPEAGSHGKDDENDHLRRPLTVVLSARLKRQDKRAELVRQLSARDSLRLRDRARAANGLLQLELDIRSIDSGQPASPAGVEFSTEEESRGADITPSAKFDSASDASREPYSDAACNRGKKLSPFDDETNDSPSRQTIALEYAPKTPYIKPSSTAGLLSSTTFNSTSSMVEGKGGRKTSTGGCKPKGDDDLALIQHGGKYPWATVLEDHDCKTSRHQVGRRSSSLPSVARGASQDLLVTKKTAKVYGAKQEMGRHSSRDELKRVSSSPDQEVRSERKSHGHPSPGSLPSRSHHPRRSSSLRRDSSSGHATSSESEMNSHKSRPSTRSRSRMGSYTSLLTRSSKHESSMKDSTTKRCDEEAMLGGRHRHQLSSAKQQGRRDASYVSTDIDQFDHDCANDQLNHDTIKNHGSSKTSDEATNAVFNDVMDQSLCLDDLARLDGSSQSVARRSIEEAESEGNVKKKKRPKKKGDRLSSSVPSHHMPSGRPLSPVTAVSDPDIFGKAGDFSGDMECSVSVAEHNVSCDALPQKSASRRKKASRSSAEDTLHARESASKMKDSGASQSLGKSPRSQHKVREKTGTVRAVKDAKDDFVATSKSKKSPRWESTDQFNQVDLSSRRQGVNINADTEHLPARNAPAATDEFPRESHFMKRDEIFAASKKQLDEANVSTRSRPSPQRKKERTRRAKRSAARVAAVDGQAINSDSVSSLPPLTDFNSIEKSTEGPKTNIISSSVFGGKSDATQPKVRRGEKSVPFIENDKSSNENAATTKAITRRLDRNHKPLKEDTLSQLDAIANDSNVGDGLDESKAKDSLIDIFLDSPSGSPLSCSLPQLWQAHSEAAVVERLVSSMPNLEYHFGSDVHTNAFGTRDSLSFTRAAFRDTDEDVFQDHSDDSLASDDMPSLEPVFDELRGDVMSRITEEDEERNIIQAIQTRPSTQKSINAVPAILTTDLTSEVLMASPLNEAILMVSSPRTAHSVDSKGKLDRGPALPRRSNSFENDQTISQVGGEPTVALELSPKQQRGLNRAAAIDPRDMPVSLENSSNSLQFRRTAGDGWVQVTQGSGGSQGQHTATQTAISNPEVPKTVDHAHAESSPTWPGLRRRASMSDLEMARSFVDDRWPTSSSRLKRSDPVPILGRQSYPSTSEAVSHSMNADELRMAISLPLVEGCKPFERTYLPVSLQSVARRYKRTWQQSPSETRSPEMQGGMSQHIAHASLDSDARGTRSKALNESKAVEAGLSNMFEMIGELEDDLNKFENKVVLLRTRRTMEESTDDLASSSP